MSTIEIYGTNAPIIGGAPKGSMTNPYTIEEFDSMCDAGTWTGGYVIGMGYVLGNADVDGSWNYSFFDPFGSFSNPWDDDDDDDTPNSGGGGGGGAGGSGNGGNGSGTGNNIDLEAAELIWGKYEPDSTVNVCTNFLPAKIPKQVTIHDCFTAALANAKLLDMVDMTNNEYSNIRQCIMAEFERIVGHSVMDKGITPDEFKMHYSDFGLGSSSVEYVLATINMGRYMFGVINYPETADVTHAVIIVGYDKKNPNRFLCMDSFQENSQFGSYKFYEKSRFDCVYRFK